jgi:hypothetical protein
MLFFAALSRMKRNHFLPLFLFARGCLLVSDVALAFYEAAVLTSRVHGFERPGVARARPNAV